TSAPNSSPASTGPQSHVHAQALLSSARSLPFGEESMNGYSSSVDSPTTLSGHGQPKADEKATVELLVSLDNTFREDDQDARWTYSMDVKNVTSILSQLVENAIKFTKSGYVEVSAVSSPTNLRLKPPVPDAQAIVFTVRDTGKGISSDYVQTSLFNRFTQEDPLAVGTGLGLALVKLRVERLGGWLEISSEGIEGKGCEVKVLIWATKSMSRPSRSLREISGSWQQKSCRFYVGASSVATNKLWDTMALGMMQQQLNMTVVRGNERETSAEAMLRDVSDSAQCDLLVINDDITRLKTYLAHWAEGEEDEDEPRPDGPEEGEEIEAPTPLLILVSEDNAKIVRRLVDEYLQTQAETKAAERPATIVIMPKPIGPLKLAQCLRDCFTPAVVGGGFQSRQGSPSLLPKHLPFPLIRASTVPHITTAALGVHSNQMMSAGGVIKSTFVFPTSGYDGDLRGPMMMLPPHSPGGLVLPPRYLSIGTCSNSMAEHEGCPSHQHQHYYYHHHHHHQHHPPSSDETSGAAEATDAAAAENKDKPEGDGDGNQSGPSNQASVPKKRFQRSIRNFASQRHLRKTSISNGGSPSSPSSSALSSPSFARSTGGDSVQSSPTIPEQSLLSDHQSVPRVLIVEDNDTNRMILKTFLKKRGVGVVEAENGQLGVERFQEEVLRRHGRQGFEVVLMDLQMPVMDGNLATKRIREFEQMMVKQHGLSLPQAAGMNQVTSAGSSGAGGHPGEESGSSSNSKEETEGDVDEATETTEAKLGNGVTMAGTSGHRCNFDGRGYRPTVIYALTGLAGDEDKRLAYDCGVDDYLTKPVSLKTLGSLLAKHLTIPLS
ncbi:His Kinase A domain containing protein, partial [Lunasporangiospora selenospora]